MDDRQVEALKGSVQQGLLMEEFVRHPGYQILKRFIEEKISDSRKDWLNAKSSIEAEEIRIKTKPWNEIYNFLTTKILQGRAAQQKLESEEV